MDPQFLPPQPSQEQATDPQVLPPAMTPTPQHSKKRSAIILAAVLLLVGLGTIIGLHYTREPAKPATQAATATTDEESHKFEAVVRIDGSGFTPATLSVKPDTEVFIENHATNAEGEAGSPQKVVQSKAAANQEANFNAGLILANGGYGHVFRQAGTYHFYNPANVQQTLTVLVK